MTEKLTARPARSDRRVTTCIECHETLKRESAEGRDGENFFHVSTGRNECPDFYQPDSAEQLADRIALLNPKR